MICLKYPWLDEFCLSLTGAVKDYKEEWEATRYMVGGKMFLMLGEDNQNRPIITLKLEPQNGEFMRTQYKGTVFPGYYMNKLHWNSILYSGSLPDDELKAMIKSSHSLIFNSLTKKAQKELSGL